MRKLAAFVLLGLILAAPAGAQRLFVALESDQPAYITDLSGFPDVTWTPLWNFGASGAAADADGHLYLCEGAFSTHLYVSTNLAEPEQIATCSVDITGLAYGRGSLFGYSNYADPKGIYQIDTTNGCLHARDGCLHGHGFPLLRLRLQPG